ncbi:SDR family NAD(P)-dependent oxidoreductase [Aestuariibacter sp. AA17]|uniref:SDR family NAD(P)-dependent oxidoreductase n=1 Tax=Fluctibacter corallii TaxID=2984329 RepID=A0ABT3A485_9ALTE|nr:SDR family NAD(P)-dependent oxidoreductase [Aestuariibacter sp. AA17]MCV2883201.1 SDR family NAD(P)-dependent oxidoreductase [Aestuariibacter sp. AA17]
MKTMLITGATSGIGRALVNVASANDWNVIACGRNEAALQQLRMIKQVKGICFDVTQKDAVNQSLSSIDAPDVVVLNAGVCEYVDVEAFDSDMFERVFAVNFFGVVHCIEALLPKLRRGSQIVIVDSLARLLPFTKSQAYGASKAATHYLTKTLAVDLKARGIIVQSVSPGFIETPMTDQNDFDMPMKMHVDDAAKALFHGIRLKERSIYFPYGFAFILRALSKLPNAVKVWLGGTLNKQ